MGYPWDENFRTLTQFFNEQKLVNAPADLMEAMVGWIESGQIPAMCKQNCVLRKGEVECPHGQSSILNYFNAGTVRDACLIVNLKRLGVTGDLQYIRDKHTPKAEEVMG